MKLDLNDTKRKVEESRANSNTAEFQKYSKDLEKKNLDLKEKNLDLEMKNFQKTYDAVHLEIQSLESKTVLDNADRNKLEQNKKNLEMVSKDSRK